MNKTMQNVVIGLTFLSSYCDGLVVPQEAFSLLTKAMESVPPIKKGTDLRFGVGFRLGEHADFQTIIELGPQRFTKPLEDKTNENIGGNDKIKRMVKQTECNVTKPTYEKSSHRIHNTEHEKKDIKPNPNERMPRFAEHYSFKSLFNLKN